MQLWASVLSPDGRTPHFFLWEPESPLVVGARCSKSQNSEALHLVSNAMPSLTLLTLNRANSILLIAFDNTHFDKYIVLKCHSHLMIPPLQLGPFDMQDASINPRLSSIYARARR